MRQEPHQPWGPGMRTLFSGLCPPPSTLETSQKPRSIACLPLLVCEVPGRREAKPLYAVPTPWDLVLL